MAIRELVLQCPQGLVRHDHHCASQSPPAATTFSEPTRKGHCSTCGLHPSADFRDELGFPAFPIHHERVDRSFSQPFDLRIDEREGSDPVLLLLTKLVRPIANQRCRARDNDLLASRFAWNR